MAQGASDTTNMLFQAHVHDVNQADAADIYSKELANNRQDAKTYRDWAENMWNKNNQFNLDMWNRQQAQNLANWNMQNQYNSPSAQMDRMRQAGINPAMMYGNMSNGPSIEAPSVIHASAPSGSTSSPAHSNFTPMQANAPTFDLNKGVLAGSQLTVQNAQADNLRSQSELLQAQKVKTAVETANEGLRGSGLGLDNELKKASMGYAIDALKLNNDRSTLEMSLNSRLANREDDKLTIEWKRLKNELANSEQTREVQNLQKQIMQYEIGLNKIGLTKNDNVLYREFAPQVKTILEALKPDYNNYPLKGTFNDKMKWFFKK
jgi:hypothetical protein